MKKQLAVVMATLLALGTIGMSACDELKRDDVGDVLDNTKSLLNIGVFNAGYGVRWAEEAVKDFEEFYKNTEFEPGKKGVEVQIDPRKDEFKPVTLKATITSNKNTLYFLNEFSDLDGFYASGLVADMTDVLNEKVYDEDGSLAAKSGGTATKSMYDIMYDEFKGADGKDGYFEKNGKAYAAPWAFDCAGMIYDADLFDENGYYFDADGNLGCTQEDIDNGDCGPGPDQQMGTPDDGMPETWNDFVTLMNHMKNGGDNVTPFIWAGKTFYQQVRAYESVWANYEGYDDYMLNFKLEGEDAQLGEITPATSGKLSEQEGIKAAIKMAYDITKGDYYFSRSSTLDFKDAQTRYIASVNETNQIAMFMENGYWEIEAIDTFNLMDMGAGTGFGERNFKRFPIPNFVGVEGITDQTEESIREPEVLVGHSAYKNVALLASQCSCTNDYNVNLKLAKLFLQFVHSREMLAQFTANTGACIASYHFDPTPDEMATFTKFGQNIFEYMKNGSKMAIDVPLHEFRKTNVEEYAETGYFHVKAVINGTNQTHAHPWSVFEENPNMTVDECWSYMQASYKELASKYGR